MNVSISRIKITERIRKEITRIDELAADIRQNGLLNPLTVMAADGGEFRLLAGLRRLRAVQALGWLDVDVNIVAPADAESALRIEISENEQREPFTFSEKIDFGRLIEEIETAKAKERMSLGGKGGISQGTDLGPYLEKRERRDVIGEKIGMSGKQYDRAKYIVANASMEIIDELDRGERSIRGTYDELRDKENLKMLSEHNNHAKTKPKTGPERQGEALAKTIVKSNKANQSTRARVTKSMPYLEKLKEQDTERIRKQREYEALPLKGKIAELQRQLKEERTRAASAESELTMLKEQHHNDVFHKDSIIESLKRQNSEINEALKSAYARINELEQMYENQMFNDAALLQGKSNEYAFDSVAALIENPECGVDD